MKKFKDFITESINKPNTLEISSFGPRYNKDFEYVATYKKGKNAKLTPENMRLLMKDPSGNECIMFFEVRESFMGMRRTPGATPNKMFFMLHSIESIQHVSPDEIKNIENKRYTYHRVGVNPQDVNDLFQAWKDSDPMVIVGQYTHQKISLVPNYTWTYRYNGIDY